MFERRARAGQCINQPYLGTREFACAFNLVDDIASAVEPKPPIAESRDLGWMLYDMDFSQVNDPSPRFFNAKMHAGVVQVPVWESDEVRG